MIRRVIRQLLTVIGVLFITGMVVMAYKIHTYNRTIACVGDMRQHPEKYIPEVVAMCGATGQPTEKCIRDYIEYKCENYRGDSDE